VKCKNDQGGEVKCIAEGCLKKNVRQNLLALEEIDRAIKGTSDPYYGSQYHAK